jgi:hypothetical protein
MLWLAVKNALIGDLELEPPKRMPWVEFKGDEDLVSINALLSRKHGLIYVFT